MSTKKKKADDEQLNEACEPEIPPDAEPSDTPPPSQDVEWEAAIASIELKLKEQEDRYLRLRAEYENYRRRTAADLDRRFAEGMAAAASALLPVYDNLSRALRQPTADSAYAEGVALIRRGLVDSLDKIGVKEIPALGLPFDAAIMDAVMHVEDESLGESVVAEVFEPGFMIGDRVLRHAVVKVAN